MKESAFFLLVLQLILFTVPASAAENAVKQRTVAGFEKIKSLTGVWNGTLPDGKPIKITYIEISGGAIVEMYHSDDPMWWNMSTAYHPDTDKIMMTHYCSWGNHPRMSAAVADGPINSLHFNFIDIARNEPGNGYMRDLTFNFKDHDHISHDWIWHQDGKDTPLTLTLIRSKPLATKGE
jgi:hypothetical protein